jgi:pyrroline-5-carboxylate reductase
MIKLGVIGCGNMGGAMLRQLLKCGILQPGEVLAADKNEALLGSIKKETGIGVTTDNRQAAKASMVLLAVKPQFISEVAEEIREAVPAQTLILSIVTGYSVEALQKMLGLPHGAVIRVMPNTPALVGEGVLAACRSPQVTDAQWQSALQMLSCMGLAEEVPERLMDAVTGLSGSSPAFAFLFLEALSDAGVRGGLPRDMAKRFAAQTLLGSAKLALETGMHPGQLKDMVTSPAGTTIEGVAALEKDGFRYAVMDAVDAAIRRAKALGEKK